MRWARITAGLATSALTLLAFNVPSAQAASPYQASVEERRCFTSTACVTVTNQSLIGTRYAQYDTTAGLGRIQAGAPDPRASQWYVQRVQIDKVVLRTQYGVLTVSGSKNSGWSSPPTAAVQGPGHLWGRYCTTNYRVDVSWSARLGNGELKTGTLLGPWYKSPACAFR